MTSIKNNSAYINLIYYSLYTFKILLGCNIEKTDSVGFYRDDFLHTFSHIFDECFLGLLNERGLS